MQVARYSMNTVSEGGIFVIRRCDLTRHRVIAVLLGIAGILRVAAAEPQNAET